MKELQPTFCFALYFFSNTLNGINPTVFRAIDLLKNRYLKVIRLQPQKLANMKKHLGAPINSLSGYYSSACTHNPYTKGLNLSLVAFSFEYEKHPNLCCKKCAAVYTKHLKSSVSDRIL